MYKKKPGNIRKINILWRCLHSKQKEYLIVGLIDQEKSNGIYWTLRKV